jgi:hypothetical protein
LNFWDKFSTAPKPKPFEGEFKVGDKVKALVNDFESHNGREDLVVLYMDQDEGYGVGPEGNDPDKDHDKDGWFWYFPDEIAARD